MAGPIRKSRVKEVPLSEVKDDLSRFLREAERAEIVIKIGRASCRERVYVLV